MIEILPNWHPVFVHFTVALLFVAATLLWLGWAMREQPLGVTCLTIGHWLLWIGAGFTVATVAAGLYAYATVAHSDAGHAAMTDHRNWALPTAAVWWALALWAAWRVRNSRAVGLPFLGAVVVAAGMLAVTAYKGGELVFRHGVGVEAARGAAAAPADAGHIHGTPGDMHEQMQQMHEEMRSAPMHEDGDMMDHMEEGGHMDSPGGMGSADMDSGGTEPDVPAPVDSAAPSPTEPVSPAPADSTAPAHGEPGHEH